jgi:serine/threonine protein kinase
MVRQIASADFKIPTFLSPAFRELIRGLIQVDPDARTPIDQILKHPWLKVASQAKALSRPGGGLPPIGMAPIGMARGGSYSNLLSARSKPRDPFQIVSPFEEPIQELPEEQGPPRASARTPLGVAGLTTIAHSRRASMGSLTKYSARKQ